MEWVFMSWAGQGSNLQPTDYESSHDAPVTGGKPAFMGAERLEMSLSARRDRWHRATTVQPSTGQGERAPC